MQMKMPLMVMALAATMASCHCREPREKSHAEPGCANCPMQHAGPMEPGVQWDRGRGGPGGEDRWEHGDKPHLGEMMGGEMMGEEMMGGGMMAEKLLYPPPLLMHSGTEAGVTEEQMTKSRQDFFDTQTRIADLEPKLKKARIEMHRLLTAAQLDDAKILAQMDEASKAQTEIKKQRFAMLLRIRGLLTPDQRKKLDGLKHRHAGHEEAMESAGPGPGRPPPVRK
jgi:Spy/CpxP family protein refolding chaperone